jgi:small nuclear ribonucleoprotein D2
MNMILEQVCETWTETTKAGKGKKSKAILKERVVPKLFLRGDSVILAVKNPR